MNNIRPDLIASAVLTVYFLTCFKAQRGSGQSRSDSTLQRLVLCAAAYEKQMMMVMFLATSTRGHATLNVYENCDSEGAEKGSA